MLIFCKKTNIFSIDIVITPAATLYKHAGDNIALQWDFTVLRFTRLLDFNVAVQTPSHSLFFTPIYNDAIPGGRIITGLFNYVVTIKVTGLTRHDFGTYEVMAALTVSGVPLNWTSSTNVVMLGKRHTFLFVFFLFF